MKTTHVQHDTLKQLDLGGRRSTTQPTHETPDFKRQLAASALKPERVSIEGKVFGSLYSEDYLNRNPFLQAKSAGFEALTAKDFKGLASASASAPALAPLADADFLPGAKSQPQTRHEKLTEQTQKWVAQTFYGTMLKQMRNSPFKSEIFDGGRGGEAYNTLFDQHLADHMAKGTENKLVNGIVKQIEHRQAAALSAAGASSSPGDAGVSPAFSPNEEPRDVNTGFQRVLQSPTHL